MKVLAFVFLALIGSSQASFQCVICEDGISFIDGLLKNGEQNIEGKVEKFCDDLGFLATLCKSIIAKNLPTIIDALGNKETEKTICNKLGHLCEQDKELPSFSIECEVCEYMIKIIGELGTDEEPKIEEVVDKVCSKLGSFFEKACDALVRTYLPKLIDALKNGATEEEACSVIRLCSSKKAVVKPVVQPVVKPVVKPVVEKQTKDFTCDICKQLVNLAANLLNESDSTIENKLDSYCEDLPIFVQQCENLVKEYVPKIIGYLKDGKDEQYICSELDLCSSAKNFMAQKAFMAHVKGQTKGVTCDICDEVCKWIEDYGANKGIEEIEKYVDGKCDDLPFISGACKDLVNKWLGKLVPLLQKDLPPKKVCDDVHLC